MILSFFMKNSRITSLTVAMTTSVSLLALTGCKAKKTGNGAPPATQVIHVADMNLITIDAKDVAKFPVTTATQIESAIPASSGSVCSLRRPSPARARRRTP